MERRALILANGTAPTRRLLQAARRHAELFICADGGANTAAQLGQIPDMIIGDLDSIKSSTVKVFRSVLTRRVAEQNSTDLEKAIRFLIRKNYRQIDVLGALGGRVDHVVGNLSTLGKYRRSAGIRFADNSGYLVPVGSSLTWEAVPGTTVSLIPLGRCEGIVTSGLKWELKNGTLELGVRDSTSNIVRSSPFTVSVRRGELLLYVLVSPLSLYSLT